MAAIIFPRFKICFLWAFAAAVLIFFFICGVINWSLNSNFGNRIEFDRKDFYTSTSGKERVNIALVICGNESIIDYALTTMKSAILFCGPIHIHFLIICQDHLRNGIYSKLEILQLGVDNTVFTYDLHNISFPKENEEFWRFSYKECSTQRLFFADIFPHIEKVLYVDVDVLFLNSLVDIWHYSSKMNRSQLIAAGIGRPNRTNYNRLHHIQYPLALAPTVNSGVMIMDLSKMREFGWIPRMLNVFKKYRQILVLADQDIMRLTFFFHPGLLYSLPCNYNYHQGLCRYAIPCAEAETQGVYFLHGSGGARQNNQVFRIISRAFLGHQIGLSSKKYLVSLLKKDVENVKHESCIKMNNTIFLKHINKILSTS